MVPRFAPEIPQGINQTQPHLMELMAPMGKKTFHKKQTKQQKTTRTLNMPLLMLVRAKEESPGKGL